MRWLSTVLNTTVAAALLASCSGNGSSPNSLARGGGDGAIPQARDIFATVPMNLIRHEKFRGRLAPASAAKGIIVSEAAAPSGPDIIGFPKNNSSNGPPVCTLTTGSGGVNDIASDGAGNIIVPNGFYGVLVYAPPPVSGACGTLLGTIPDGYGQASTAASNDALKGKIVVGQFYGGSYASVATCKLSSLTCRYLISPNLGGALAGVAMDKAGNCYADAVDSSGHTGLWYYAGCTGTGTELTAANGFNEPNFGGISVDNRGNLVVISVLYASPSTVTVYSGCNTGTCTAIGGPFTLQGISVWGHLGRQNKRWVTVDLSDSMVEVYAYAPGGSGLSYMYSFNNGLDCYTDHCVAAAYQPGSPR